MRRRHGGWGVILGMLVWALTSEAAWVRYETDPSPVPEDQGTRRITGIQRHQSPPIPPLEGNTLVDVTTAFIDAIAAQAPGACAAAIRVQDYAQFLRVTVPSPTAPTVVWIHQTDPAVGPLACFAFNPPNGVALVTNASQVDDILAERLDVLFARKQFDARTFALVAIKCEGSNSQQCQDVRALVAPWGPNLGVILDVYTAAAAAKALLPP